MHCRLYRQSAEVELAHFPIVVRMLKPVFQKRRGRCTNRDVLSYFVHTDTLFDKRSAGARLTAGSRPEAAMRVPKVDHLLNGGLPPPSCRPCRAYTRNRPFGGLSYI